MDFFYNVNNGVFNQFFFKPKTFKLSRNMNFKTLEILKYIESKNKI